jgi:hypothetical protein
MANRLSIAEKIEKLKQMATLGLAETEQLLGGDRQHKSSIPDRRIAMKYLDRREGWNGPEAVGAASSGRVGAARGNRAFEGRNSGSVEGVPH